MTVDDAVGVVDDARDISHCAGEPKTAGDAGFRKASRSRDPPFTTKSKIVVGYSASMDVINTDVWMHE